MEYRILGRTGLKVGAIALGCEGFADKTAEEVRADFDFAIRNGINFLDLYASNPELRSNIGAALAGRREKFVIQGHLCSVWEGGQYLRTRDPEKSLAAFEDLLARLGTDYVEIGMIHYVDAEADLREVLDGPIMRLAQRLRSEGRIRHIGLSSHNPVVAHMAARTGLIDVLMFSVNPVTTCCRRATTWIRSGRTRVTRGSCTTSTPNGNGSTNSANAKGSPST